MDLELQIKALERKLKLKQAYASVGFTFGKGYKSFPDDIRDEVEATLRSFAQGVASEGSVQDNAGFTAEELEALKMLARSVIRKQSTGPVPGFHDTTPGVAANPPPAPEPRPLSGNTPPAPSSFEDNSMIGRLAKLLWTENVPKNQRALVNTESELKIVDKTSVKFLVNNQQGVQFWIPRDDIELI